MRRPAPHFWPPLASRPPTHPRLPALHPPCPLSRAPPPPRPNKQTASDPTARAHRHTHNSARVPLPLPPQMKQPPPSVDASFPFSARPSFPSRRLARAAAAAAARPRLPLPPPPALLLANAPFLFLSSPARLKTTAWIQRRTPALALEAILARARARAAAKPIAAERTEGRGEGAGRAARAGETTQPQGICAKGPVSGWQQRQAHRNASTQTQTHEDATSSFFFGAHTQLYAPRLACLFRSGPERKRMPPPPPSADQSRSVGAAAPLPLMRPSFLLPPAFTLMPLPTRT